MTETTQAQETQAQVTETETPVPGPHTPPPPRSLRPWLVAAVAALAIVTSGAFTTLGGLLVGPLSGEFGWSRGAIGVALAVNMVLYGGTAPFAAALMDRFGMRRIVTSAVALIGLGAGLATTMTTAWQLVLYWGVFVGLGCGAAAMALAATVTERWFLARRGLVTGALTAAGVFGQFVFLPVLSRIIDAHTWRTAALTLAVTAAVATVAVGLFLRDHPADVGLAPYGASKPVARPKPVPGALLRTLRVLRRAATTGPFWLLAGTFAVCGASTNGVMWTHFAPAAHDHGMPVTTAASLLALIGVFNIAGTVASGWFTDRIDPRRLLATYYALRGLTLLILPLLLTSTVQPPLVAFVIVFGLLDVATVPPTLALCRAHFGPDAAIVFGWVSAAHQIGAGSVAFLGSVSRDTFGTYDPLWIAAGTLCATAALLALTLRAARPEAADGITGRRTA